MTGHPEESMMSTGPKTRDGADFVLGMTLVTELQGLEKPTNPDDHEVVSETIDGVTIHFIGRKRAGVWTNLRNFYSSHEARLADIRRRLEARATEIQAEIEAVDEEIRAKGTGHGPP
jgi:hypothetical protein